MYGVWVDGGEGSGGDGGKIRFMICEEVVGGGFFGGGEFFWNRFMMLIMS